jgi:hypothetical protein
MAANLKADFFATRKKNSERKFYKWRVNFEVEWRGSRAGLPDFFGPKVPKRENISKDHKLCTPNCHTSYQMAINYTQWP